MYTAVAINGGLVGFQIQTASAEQQQETENGLRK